MKLGYKHELVKPCQKRSVITTTWGKRGWHSGESTQLPPVWPRFNSRTKRHVFGLSFVVGSRPCSESFSPGPPVFPPPQKPTFPDSNSIWNPRAIGLTIEKLFSVTLLKQS